MADPKELEATRMARKEFTKRPLDISRCDIRVMHGVVYVRGQIGLMRGGEGSVDEYLEQIKKILRAKPEIRDVVVDASVRG